MSSPKQQQNGKGAFSWPVKLHSDLQGSLKGQWRHVELVTVHLTAQKSELCMSALLEQTETQFRVTKYRGKLFVIKQ